LGETVDNTVLTRSGIARRETPVGPDGPDVPVELYYEDLGDPAAPPALLIMGLGAQLPMWPDGFCEQLVDAGYRVIRFDNRDAGLSAKMHGRRARGTVYRRVGRYLLGRPSAVPYTLIDMAKDAVALLDHLGIGRTHVVGASLGGMIAQILAGTEPDRVASLGIIMSTTGKPFPALPTWRVIKLAFEAPAKDASAEEKLDFEVRNIALFNGPNFLPSQTELRRRVQQLADRCNSAAVRRHAGHRQPARLQQGDHRAHGGAARFGRPDGSAAQRTGGRRGHPRRAIRRDRRNGTRSSETGLAADRRDPDRELRAFCVPVSALTGIGT